MKSKPYVGVTGLTSIGEVNQTINNFNSMGFSLESSHLPMIGFLASYKTLFTPNVLVENRRYPKLEKILPMLEECRGKVLPTIHYNSRHFDEIDLSEQIFSLMEEYYDKGLCRTIQLNITMPEISEVEKIKKAMPDLKIIFQASQKIIDDKKPNEVAKEISKYDDLIDYVLIYPSSGQGKEFDIGSSIKIYKEINEVLPKVMIGFADGFTGKNVNDRLTNLIEESWSTDFSIDAEGGLRDKKSDKYGDDFYNQIKVKNYIGGSSIILR